jgi:outer membrane protein assembly factor BamB/tetratricopeptide (TPR) repeat protein
MNPARLARVFAMCSLIGLCAAPARGQAPARPSSKFYPDSSDQAERFLRSAASHVRERQWAEAIDLYQRVIEQFGDKVAKLPKEWPGADLPPDFALYVEGRRYCHAALAHLPAEARAIYRNRYDSVAEHWFREGARKRDLTLLHRVVDQAFCSAWGDDALELLGDLAYQDGRFGEALAHYGHIVADRPDDTTVLIHPDPSVDLARVAAKKLLCRASAGEYPPGPADLAEFARLYPGASGDLAGRTGEYTQVLREALESDNLRPVPQPDSRWPTFAGSSRRTKVVPGPIDVGSMQWHIELEKVSRNMPGLNTRGFVTAPAQVPAERLLAFHPIVLGDQVIVCDGTRVLAYNLNDRPFEGDATISKLVEPAWKGPADENAAGPQARQMYSSIPRYTLTAYGRRIYARMGATSNASFPGMGFGGMTGRGGTSSIVALDWNDQGKLIWEQKSTAVALPNRPPDRGRNSMISFEGTPVADARSVYVAITDRRDQPSTYIGCYDAATGANRWIRYVGSASLEADNFFGMGMGNPMQFGMSAPGDFNHRLLSLDGPTLYYQTNLGALVAIDAESGATVWVATYPRQEPNHNGSERDLNPAIVHDGRVFVAPSDSDSLYAFDAASGRLSWKSEKINDDVKLTHVLGVAKDRLIATGNRVLIFDVKTGKLLHAWPDGKSLEGHGRGLLAGDLIYWPTQNEIQVLDQRTGLRALPPIRLFENFHAKGGNLVAGDGYLIVAQSDGLVVFCQNSRLIERYRQDIARAPDHAANYFRMARAAEALGQDDIALETYAAATAKAKPHETIDGFSLENAARDHQFRLLLRVASQLRRTRQWKAAAARLETAAGVARFDPERLQAQLLLADVLLDAGRPREAVAICERLLTDERLRPLPVATIAADDRRITRAMAIGGAAPASGIVSVADGRRTVRADLLIADRLSAIVREHGRKVYEPYDTEARRVFEKGLAEKDPRMLDQVCRLYPEAQVVPDALLELGALYERANRLTEATHAYKRMLMANIDERHRALASWHLAHVYEERKLFLAARDTLLELQSRFPSVHLKGDFGSGSVTELVAAELARPRYTQLTAELPLPPLALPLLRRWHLPVPDSQSIHLLSALGLAPAADSSRVFLVEKGTLRFIDPATGLTRWSSDLGAPAVWAGYLGDKLIAATPRQIFGLELGQGIVQWRYEVPRAEAEPKPDPFAIAGANDTAQRRDQFGELMSEFQIVKGRIFCLRGRRELLALDGDTGALDWSFSSPPGEINPKLWIGADRIVLQVDKPNQLLVLRTDDGQPLLRVALAEKEVFERPPMPLDDDSVLLVPDRRTVKRFDLRHGQTLWVYQESEHLPVNGPPRLLANSDCLLVLHDGRQLIRLDPATGSKRWSALLGTEDLSERPGAMAYDDKTFYCVNVENIHGGMREALRALALDDGSRVWSCPLTGPPDTVWSIALAERCVIAYPSSTRLPEGGPIVNMPVTLRRRDTGALVQRFVVSTKITDVTLRVDPRGAFLATSRGLWALGSKEVGQAPVSERLR